jgi:uncharacterized sulfatase
MSDQRPNILLMMTDTQNRPMLGCYAGKDMGTPHLDGLAADGVRFDRGYTTCPLCTPARAGLFTGMMPSRAGAYTNSLPLGANILTMGQRLQSVGYRTAYMGKWHLDGHDYFGNGECPPGWEEAYWYDGKRYMLELSQEDAVAWRRELHDFSKLEARDIRSEFTWAHRISHRAERFLSENDGSRPWLLVCSYDEPHHPWTCPKEYVHAAKDFVVSLGSSGRDTLENKPAHQREWREKGLGVWQRHGKGATVDTWSFPFMLGCNSYVDAQMGRVIAAARASAKATGRATWIFYTADHGDHHGSHGLFNKGPTGYEFNVGIPFIVVPPEGAITVHDGPAHGRVQQTAVSHLDILPTMLELAGLPVPATLDGTSLLPLLGHQRREDRAVVTEYTRYELGHDGFGGLEPLRMYLRWPWKLVINLHQTDELYNLAEDPDEMVNRIGDASCAAERDRLHDELIDWMYAHVDPARGRPWECRPWHDASRPNWHMPLRPVRDDGVMAPYLDYDTGLPTEGARHQYSDKKA